MRRCNDVSIYRYIKTNRLWLIGILVLVLALRLVAINQSLWLDEAVQAWASSSFSIKELLIQYMPGDFNPPLYHILLHFWIKMFGTSEIDIRSLSLVLSLGSILLFYWVINELNRAGKKKPVNSLINNRLIVLLLATAPLHIYYSQENRMYMLACLTVLLAAWRFLIFLENPSWKNSICFGISLVIMGFSHFLTLLTLPVFLFWGIRGVGESQLPRTIKLARIGVVFGLLLVAHLVYLPLFLKQLETGLIVKSQFPVWGKTVGSFTLKSAALLPVKFLIGRVSIINKLIYGLLAVVLVAIYWLVPLFSLMRYALARCGLRFREKFVLSFLLVPPVLGFLISFWLPVFSYFRFLYLLPFFYLFVGLGLGKFGKLGKLGVLALVAVNLICSGIYLLNPKFHRENWRGMVLWLHQGNKRNLPVLILDQVAKPFEYYDHDQSRLILISPSGEKTYNFLKNCKEKSGCRQLFLVSYGLPIFDPEDKIRKKLRNSGFEIKKGESFNQVGVEIWEVSE